MSKNYCQRCCKEQVFLLNNKKDNFNCKICGCNLDWNGMGFDDKELLFWKNKGNVQLIRIKKYPRHGFILGWYKEEKKWKQVNTVRFGSY